jgi:hypothetical protein
MSYHQSIITKASSPMRYHNASSAISRPHAKYNFALAASVISFTPEQLKRQRTTTLQSGNFDREFFR